MIKFFLLWVGLSLKVVAHANSMVGCYLESDEIANAASGESEQRPTYIKVSKKSGNYFAQGMIWGGNFHICNVSVPGKGVDEPLKMTANGNQLFYSQVDPEYDVNCKLTMSFENNSLTISDENNNCSNYVFFCGANVGVGGVTLPKVDQECQ